MLFDQGVKSEVRCHTDLASVITVAWELMGKFCKCGKGGGSFQTDHTHSIKKVNPGSQLEILAAPSTEAYHLQICLSLLPPQHTHLSSCLHEGNQAWPATGSLGQYKSMLLPNTTSGKITYFRHAAAVRSARTDAYTSEGSAILKAYICVCVCLFIYLFIFSPGRLKWNSFCTPVKMMNYFNTICLWMPPRAKSIHSSSTSIQPDLSIQTKY